MAKQPMSEHERQMGEAVRHFSTPPGGSLQGDTGLRNQLTSETPGQADGRDMSQTDRARDLRRRG